MLSNDCVITAFWHVDIMQTMFVTTHLKTFPDAPILQKAAARAQKKRKLKGKACLLGLQMDLPWV